MSQKPTRIQHKHDTEAKWEVSELRPMSGEIIIYDADAENPYPRIKIGDGSKFPNELPFVATGEGGGGGMQGEIYTSEEKNKLKGLPTGPKLSQTLTTLEEKIDNKTVDLTDYPTFDEVTEMVDNLVDAAPGALDTLNELAAALGNDPNFATTITNELSTINDELENKVPIIYINDSEEEEYYNSCVTDGEYVFVINDPDGTMMKILYVFNEFGNPHQISYSPHFNNTKWRYKGNDGWSEWENDTETFTPELCQKLELLPTKSQLDEQFKNIKIDLPLKKGTGTESLMGINSTRANTASGEASFTFGEGNIASAKCSIATGRITKASGISSHAEGYHTEATAEYSHAEGNDSEAHGQSAHSEGIKTIAYGQASHAEGYSSTSAVEFKDLTESDVANLEQNFLTAYGKYSHAEGANTRAIGTSSHTEGVNTKAIGAQSHSEGSDTTSIGNSSHAEGKSTVAEGNYSHAEGQLTQAKAFNAHTEGYETHVYEGANNGHAEGAETEVYGENAHAEGYSTEAYASHSHVEGIGTVTETTAIGGHAEGIYTIAKGVASHAEGRGSIANAEASHAEGGNYLDKNEDSNKADDEITLENGVSYKAVLEKIVEFYNKTIQDITKDQATLDKFVASMDFNHKAIYNNPYSYTRGIHAHSEGSHTNAIGLAAHSEGYGTVAYDDATHAEGRYTYARGVASHSEGGATKATKNYAHSEGYKSEADGLAAHAEGSETKATANYAHAEGYKSEALGKGSHAEGYVTKAQGDYQHVEGKCNIIDTENQYAHIVGNGTSNVARSNAHTLDWNGNAWFAGSISANDLKLKSKNNVVYGVKPVAIDTVSYEYDYIIFDTDIMELMDSYTNEIYIIYLTNTNGKWELVADFSTNIDFELSDDEDDNWPSEPGKYWWAPYSSKNITIENTPIAFVMLAYDEDEDYGEYAQSITIEDIMNHSINGITIYGETEYKLTPEQLSDLGNPKFYKSIQTVLNERLEEEQNYMREYVDNELATFDFIKIVEQLPETGMDNRIYLVPNGENYSNDLFNEYIWADGKWEWMSAKTIEMDLTNYVPKTAFNYDATTETLTIDI